MVSMSCAVANELDQELLRLLHESKVKEAHWKELDGAKERHAAYKILRCFLNFARAGKARGDILMWDTEDSRHKIQGRDDVANLHRMYHHLLTTTMRERWPRNSKWRLHPDHNSLINWSEVAGWLEKKSAGGTVRNDLLTDGEWVVEFWDWFVLHALEPCHSHDQPCIQLADLLVGLGIYSKESYIKLEQWRKSKVQDSLFIGSEEVVKLSGSDKERCQVLHEFRELCGTHKLGVSLDNERRLITKNPKYPVNFWWWTPQHELDKAPTRVARR